METLKFIKILLLIIGVEIFSLSIGISQTTIDFESTGYTDNQQLGKSVAIEGFTFTINSSDVTDDILFDNTESGGGNSVLMDDNLDIGGITMWTITRTNDSNFRLVSLYLQEGGAGASTSGTIKAYKNGGQVGSTVNINFDGATDYTGNIDFSDIDEIRIEATDIFLHIDDLTYTLPVSVSITSVTHVDCNGASTGSITAEITPGTANYDYEWSNLSSTMNTSLTTNTISSLAAGFYTVTVTDDASSTATATIEVTQPSALVASISVDANTCAGSSDGQLTASGSGGTESGAYEFLWSNSLGTSSTVSNLASGTYSVTVYDDNGCQAGSSETIITNPVYNITETAEVCSGDSYTFPDGTTQNNITAQVIYTSNLLTLASSCDSIIETTVNVNSGYNLTETAEVCSGDSYTFPDGTTQNNITVQVIYTSNLLTVASSCDSIIETTVNVNPVYNLTETAEVCSGGTYTFPDGTTQNNITAQLIYNSNLLTTASSCDSIIETTVDVNAVDTSVEQTESVLTANAVGASYQWVDCDDSYAYVPGETNQSFTATNNGSYAVIVDNGVCVDTSICYIITGVWVNDIESTSINIYPNPTNGIIEIDLADNNIHKVIITDISGKKIIEIIPEAQNEKIDLSDFNNGLYIIMFESNKEVYTSKIIKE